MFLTQNCDAKTSNIERKYNTISDYNKFTCDIIDAKINKKS